MAKAKNNFCAYCNKPVVGIKDKREQFARYVDIWCRSVKKMFMKRQKIQKIMKPPYSMDDLLWIGKYLDKWGECKVIVEKYQDPISERQRNYYFGVVVKICEDYY